MGGWILNKILVFSRKVARLQMPLYATNVCYYLVLAVFPGLLLVLASLRYTPLSASDLIAVLENLVPDPLMGAVERLIVSTYYNSTGTMVSLSAVAAVWSASRGIYGLICGLNRVYAVRENRSFLKTRLLSAVYMVLFLVVMLLTLVLHVFGTNVIHLLESNQAPWAQILLQVVDLRMVILLSAQTLVFTLMYMVLPNQRNRFFSSIPGAVAAALGWHIFSKVFSIYVVHFDSYSNIYGSLYAVALGMLWLYCCTLILLCGGALNRAIGRWQEK